jgi:hypothetical protein
VAAEGLEPCEEVRPIELRDLRRAGQAGRSVERRDELAGEVLDRRRRVAAGRQRIQG